MTVLPISPISGLNDAAAAMPLSAQSAISNDSFGSMLLDGVQEVNRKVIDADHLVQAFALDDSVPLHQVTFALEQARLSTELMMQVRARLLEGYQEIMRMQL
jgi:flagellar hook-basal body complex protein FliE